MSRYDAIVMAEQPVAADPIERAASARRRVARARAGRGVTAAAAPRAVRRRGPRHRRAFRAAAASARSIARSRHRVRRCRGTRHARSRATAPASLTVPSGRAARLDYREDGTVMRGGEAAGAVRAGRDAAPRSPAATGGARTAGAERTAGADDTRPSQLLGPHLPRGAKGTARPLSEASVAGRSLDGDANPPDAS